MVKSDRNIFLLRNGLNLYMSLYLYYNTMKAE